MIIAGSRRFGYEPMSWTEENRNINCPWLLCCIYTWYQLYWGSNALTHSLIHSPTGSAICSLIHSSTAHLFIHSLIHSLIHSFVYLQIHSFIHSAFPKCLVGSLNCERLRMTKMEKKQLLPSSGFQPSEET